jgi:transglutaminase-like putative cysteine protease
MPVKGYYIKCHYKNILPKSYKRTYVLDIYLTNNSLKKYYLNQKVSKTLKPLKGSSVIKSNYGYLTKYFKKTSYYNIVYRSDRSKKVPSIIYKTARKLATPQKIAIWMNQHIPYGYYADTRHSLLSTFKGKASNCGDQSTLAIVMLRAAGYQAYRVHIPGHYYVAVKVDGKWRNFDTVRRVWGGNSYF